MIKAIFLLFFISGCSQYKLQTNLSNAEEDVLSSESFLRYSSDRIKKAITINKSLSGVAHCHNGNIKKGKEILKKSLQENIKSPDYWNQVGTCYYLNHQLSKAEYFYQLSIQNSSLQSIKYAPAHNNLGVIFLKQRHFKAAYKEFKTALKINKSFQTPRYNLAHLYLQFGKNKKALQEFLLLSRSSPSDPGILAGLGTSYMLLGNLVKSLNYFSKIPRPFLGRPDIATHFAMALYLTKDYERAFLVLKGSQYTKIRSIRKAAKKLLSLIESKLEAQKLAKR